MARTVDKVKLKLELEGFSAIKSIGKDFDKFTNTVKFTPKELDKLLERLKKVNKTTQLSKNSFEGQIGVLTKLRNAVGIGTQEYDRLGKEIDQVRASMDALNASGKKQTFFGKVGAGFKAGGGAALTGAVGRFLPPSAQIGGIAGFAKGGTKGAIAGGAIGLGIDAVAGGVQFARQAAIQASQVQKLEIALRGAVKTEADFQKGLKIIADTSKRLNVPIAASTKQFTTLAASVVGAGGSIEDAQVVFEGVSNSIKATGGNAEDVQSAIRAMSQIFGKGKVSAEELQGQLGERLAGAVVKFAEANGSSLQKLQKDLRDGTVGLDQVIKFAQKLNVDFAETAERVANSSADAGQRLQTQINNLSIAIGKDLIPIGAALQKQFSEILLGFQGNDGAVVALTESIKIFGGFLVSTVALVRTLVRTLVDLSKILFHIVMMQDFKAAGEVMSKGFKDIAINFEKDIQLLKDIAFGVQPPEVGEGSGANTTTEGLPKLTEDDAKKGQKILAKYLETVKDINTQIANSFVNTFKKMEDALVEFVLQGTFNFKKLAKSIIADITRIMIRTKIIAPLVGGLENIFGGGGNNVVKTIAPVVSNIAPNVSKFVTPNFTNIMEGINDIEMGRRGGNTPDISNFVNPDFTKIMEGINDIEQGRNRNALGNVIANNKIVPYAKGGLITRPQLFPLSNGAALAGEAGVEAIMPLRRGRDGKLGVEASGGNIGNITVNVDASGSSVEGDTNQSQELGNILGAAIQAELIRQKRPGGLLG
tara:strand:- start:1576 stop:3861 length:2286 start_codon:yes stop_codon:yes gene_type:complete